MASLRKLVRTYVDPELLARFRKRFPMDGATSWLLENSMRKLMSSPELDQAEASISRAIVETMQEHRVASRNQATTV